MADADEVAGSELGPADWAGRFEQQADACDALGSPLYARLLRLVGADVRLAGASWQLIAGHTRLRFGQAMPLRLLGAAHRLALDGSAAGWAAMMPSCGGTVPHSDESLLGQWHELIGAHGAVLRDGLDREVQTNEVARAAGLALGLATTGFGQTRLVELGCSGGLNLRLDRFRVDLGGIVLGDPESQVHLAPDVTGTVIASSLPRVNRRIGIDPAPLDPATDDGRLTLLSFVWPDQADRFDRVAAAIEVARVEPAQLRASADAADALREILSSRETTVIQQSIMWQYVPTDMRWAITAAIEGAGRRATRAEPLAWIRYEPDEWNRQRAALWLRRWPGGRDQLLAHVDFHGRWIEVLADFPDRPLAVGRIEC